MLEGLQARIYLAKSRILKSINPEQSDELGCIAIEEAYCMGINDPNMQLGKLLNDEPDLVGAFHEGAGLRFSLMGCQPTEYLRDVQFV